MDDDTLQLATYLLLIEHCIAGMPARVSAGEWADAVEASQDTQRELAYALPPADLDALYALCP